MGGVTVGGRRIKYLRFADEKRLLAEDEIILRDMLLELYESCEQYGMKIDVNKTKPMVTGKKKSLREYFSKYGEITEVMVMKDPTTRRSSDVRQGLNGAERSTRLVACSGVSTDISKFKLRSSSTTGIGAYNSDTTVLNGCKTWTLTLREEQRLRVFENKVLRKIFGAKRTKLQEIGESCTTQNCTHCVLHLT
ncbi:hypothetical protein ANN_08183 [Periplaneta americana]|uniref:Reverse transcriptase domain-containing protein n=1 Tax=Periplaneta americana TaxID=6978 RepID=A0ABQ8T0P4_PERAM|nr:hypothetical protein ANN_08183 [Periplaneta americana]